MLSTHPAPHCHRTGASPDRPCTHAIRANSIHITAQVLGLPSKRRAHACSALLEAAKTAGTQQVRASMSRTAGALVHAQSCRWLQKQWAYNRCVQLRAEQLSDSPSKKFSHFFKYVSAGALMHAQSCSKLHSPHLHGKRPCKVECSFGQNTKPHKVNVKTYRQILWKLSCNGA